MKRTIIVVMLLVSGIAFAGNPPVDPDCQKMATNAKGFAELKQGGIATTPDQLMKFVVTPAVATYPIRSVLQFVLNAPDSTPEQVYASLYNKCTLMTYKELFTYFQEREQVDSLRLQIAQQDQTIVALKQQVNSLQTENTSLKTVPVVNTQPAKRTPLSVHQIPLELPPGCTRADGTDCHVSSK